MTTEITTYLVRPSAASTAIYATFAFIPVIALTFIGRHLGWRGLSLAIPCALVAIVVIGGAFLQYIATIGFTGSFPQQGFLIRLLNSVRVGSSLAVFVTLIALSIVGQRKV